MRDAIIKLQGLTKDYGQGRGIFDINLEVKQGECFGYVGTNGSGKTTTIRTIMGFIKPDQGNVLVQNKDAWLCSTETKNFISYVPGEIAFPPFKTGLDFLKAQAGYLGLEDLSYMNRLLEQFRLDATANLARMSKGMKQKTALVAALMSDREILILDEPTTGLDPLMREVFIDLINSEKKRGKTIFISDHIFQEVEELCDRVAFIKDGRIVEVTDMEAFREANQSLFSIGFCDGWKELQFVPDCCDSQKTSQKSLDCCDSGEVEQPKINRCDLNQMFAQLEDREVKYINEESKTLEDYFMELYQRG